MARFWRFVKIRKWILWESGQIKSKLVWDWIFCWINRYFFYLKILIFHKRKISKKFCKIFWYIRFLLFDILIIFSINNYLSLTWQFQNKIIISFLFSQIKYYFVLISLQNIFNLSCINILVSLNLKYIWILILFYILWSSLKVVRT